MAQRAELWVGQEKGLDQVILLGLQHNVATYDHDSNGFLNYLRL